MKNWSKEEIEILEECYPIAGKKYCSKKLNRSESSVKSKAQKLGIKFHNFKTENELKVLRYEKEAAVFKFKPLEEYKTATTKIWHKHVECGFELLADPNSIIQERTLCPRCRDNENKITFTYFIYFKELDLYKVGISFNPINRLKNFGVKPSLLAFKKYETRGKAREAELLFLRKVSNYMKNTGKLTSGNTETFTLPNKNLVDQLKKSC